MKLNFFTSCLLLSLPLLLCGDFNRTACAAARTATGSIGIETPIGQTPDRPQDDSPMLNAELHLNRFVGPFGLFGGTKINLKDGLPFSKENRFWTGVEVPVGHRGLIAYSYFERRFDLSDNRFVLGARWSFSHRY